MKVGVVGEIHPSGYEIFDKHNIEYFVTNNIDEDHLIEKLQDVDGIVVRTTEINKNISRKKTIILYDFFTFPNYSCLLYTSDAADE